MITAELVLVMFLTGAWGLLIAYAVHDFIHDQREIYSWHELAGLFVFSGVIYWIVVLLTLYIGRSIA